VHGKHDIAHATAGLVDKGHLPALPITGLKPHSFRTAGALLSIAYDTAAKHPTELAAALGGGAAGASVMTMVVLADGAFDGAAALARH
jgi:hypothetical protein